MIFKTYKLFFIGFFNEEKLLFILELIFKINVIIIKGRDGNMHIIIIERIMDIIQKVQYLPGNDLNKTEDEKADQLIAKYFGYIILLFVIMMAVGSYGYAQEINFTKESYVITVALFFLFFALLYFRFGLYYPLTLVGSFIMEILNMLAFFFLIWHGIGIAVFLLEGRNFVEYSDNIILLFVLLILAGSFLFAYRRYRHEIIEYFAKIDKCPDTLLNAFRFAIIDANEKRIYDLLAKGIDVNHVFLDDKTPLTFAIEEDRNEMVQLLIKEKADVNYQNKQGQTPLMLAVLKQNIRILNLLLDNDADYLKKDKQKMTALNYAEKIKNYELRKVVRTRMPSED